MHIHAMNGVPLFMVRRCWDQCRLSYRDEGESEHNHHRRAEQALGRMGLRLVRKFQENGCEVLLSSNNDDDEATVAVRGTERSRSGIPWWMRLVRSEWALDGWGVMIDDPALEGNVHQGFMYHSSPMAVGLFDFLSRCSFKRVNFTGHSLGGAVANRLAGVMGVKGVPVGSLVTFAAPAVGDAHWANKVERVVGYQNCWRVVNCADVITRLKLQRLTSRLQGCPVRHAGQLLYINRHGRLETKSNVLDRWADRTTARLSDWHLYQLGYEHHSVESYDSAVRSICSL